MTTRLSPDGFNVTQFTINETRVAQAVTEAINAKVAMIQEAQRAEQEVRRPRRSRPRRSPKQRASAMPMINLSSKEK